MPVPENRDAWVLGQMPTPTHERYPPRNRAKINSPTYESAIEREIIFTPPPREAPRIIARAQQLPADDIRPSVPRLMHLQVCGRVESLEVEHQTLGEALALARKAFDLPYDQELELVDKDGAQVTSDAALAGMMSREETVYVHLCEFALHEFERRVDQLQHMQLGYLCDQLSTFRQEHTDIRAEIDSVRLALVQEAAARELAGDAMRREAEDALALARRCARQYEEKQNDLQAAWIDAKQGLHERGLSHASSSEDANQQVREIREAVVVEAKAREHIGLKLRHEFEELRRALQLENRDRGDCEGRLEGLIQDLRTSLNNVADEAKAEMAKLQQHCHDSKQEQADEKRDRLNGDAELTNIAKELRTSLAIEVRERSVEVSSLSARCDGLDTSTEALMLARRQGFSELTQQLGVAVESIQEEQRLRSSEDAELTKAVEALRRSGQETRQKAEASELTAGRLVHDLAKRVEEEYRGHEQEISRLLRAVSDERSARMEEDGKGHRALAVVQETFMNEGERATRERREIAQRLETCLADIKVEQKERFSLGERVSDHIIHHQKGTGEDDVLRAIEPHVKEIKELHARSLADHQDHRDAVSKQFRENRAESSRGPPSQQEQSNVDERIAASMHEAREHVMDHLQGDLTALQDGLTKVVDAVQQERRSRTEGASKLREDCREAVQKEINARLERDTRLTKDLEDEKLLRQEAAQVIEEAIGELRHGLEHHTHDDQDGSSSSASAGVGSALAVEASRQSIDDTTSQADLQVLVTPGSSSSSSSSSLSSSPDAESAAAMSSARARSGAGSGAGSGSGLG